MSFGARCLFEVETNIKYEGYIQNELDRIDKNKSLEEAKQELKKKAWPL